MYYIFSFFQTKRCYIKNRFISESRGAISDILEISNTLGLEGF